MSSARLLVVTLGCTRRCDGAHWLAFAREQLPVRVARLANPFPVRVNTGHVDGESLIDGLLGGPSADRAALRSVLALLHMEWLDGCE